VELGAGVGGVGGQEGGDAGVPGGGAGPGAAPAQGGCAVGPLHALGEDRGGVGVADQTEEAGLGLQRVHLFRVAQNALRTTGVGCGLWEQPTAHMSLFCTVFVGEGL
jgi:hypothetical protein